MEQDSARRHAELRAMLAQIDKQILAILGLGQPLTGKHRRAMARHEAARAAIHRLLASPGAPPDPRGDA